MLMSMRMRDGVVELTRVVVVEDEVAVPARAKGGSSSFNTTPPSIRIGISSCSMFLIVCSTIST
jgi:hypothetical protein